MYTQSSLTGVRQSSINGWIACPMRSAPTPLGWRLWYSFEDDDEESRMPKMIFLIFWGDGTNEEETKFLAPLYYFDANTQTFWGEGEECRKWAPWHHYGENEPLGAIIPFLRQLPQTIWGEGWKVAKMSPSASLWRNNEPLGAIIPFLCKLPQWNHLKAWWKGLPFFKLLKNTEANEAFERLKTYLTSSSSYSNCCILVTTNVVNIEIEVERVQEGNVYKAQRPACYISEVQSESKVQYPHV